MTKQKFHQIVILTGAGVSAESGLGTFRDKDGLWTKYDLEEVATPQGFARNPDLVHEFYNARRANLLAAQPNSAHHALARLERDYPGEVLIVTQNVDDLHERAGSKTLLHMHGELRKICCAHCDYVSIFEGALTKEDPCPQCGRTRSLRPAVVWFGEMPLFMDEIYQKLETCDLFVSIGTSGNVYPAAGFVQHVRTSSLAHTVEINLERSTGANLFAEGRYGQAGALVPAFVDELINK